MAKNYTPYNAPMIQCVSKWVVLLAIGSIKGLFPEQNGLIQYVTHNPDIFLGNPQSEL